MPSKHISEGWRICRHVRISRALIGIFNEVFKDFLRAEAIHERRKAREIIGTEETFIALIKKLILNKSKYNLIADYKIRINEAKRIQIIKQLKKKSDAQYNSGDYKGCIRSLRRMEKYY